MQLSNYLFFNTQCEEALAFYADCGLGKAVDVMRHSDTGAMPGKIMHARFEGPGVLSMPPTMMTRSRCAARRTS
jgi:PhnB protein